jgi:hypothetical protein
VLFTALYGSVVKVKSPVLFWITQTGRSVHFGQLAEGATFLKNQNINKTNRVCTFGSLEREKSEKNIFFKIIFFEMIGK